MTTASFLGKWTRNCGTSLLDAITLLVFLFLDFLDVILCSIYQLFDKLFEGKASACYCENRGDENGDNGDDDKGERELSETLYGRENVFRKMGFLGFARKWEFRRRNGFGRDERRKMRINRWSDCGCDSCVSWRKLHGFNKLHVAVRELLEGRNGDPRAEKLENVIFVHGFLSSSSFWTETVFDNVCDHYRLFAVDLLGFGRSPKPYDNLYTLSDHVEMIEKSVISPFQLKSFHLVAHSMGCIIAVALAAKYPQLVKSVTIVAPPYFPSAKDGTSSSTVLKTLAGKRLWPPLAFGQSVMSWYEHVGRTFCFLFCRNHWIWERIQKLVTRKRELGFKAVDLTRHTHHSAWHSMHNVICGGAKFVDGYLEILNKSRVKICIIHGDQDPVVPLECSINMKKKFPDVELHILQNANHETAILGREREFCEILRHTWASSYNTEAFDF